MIAKPARPARHRLFFALWPDDSLRERIGTAVQPMLEGKRARKIQVANLHITLAFLGAVLESDFAKVIAAGDRTRGEPFDFTIDRLESWRAAHVACLMIAPDRSPSAAGAGAQERPPVPAAMAALVERLRFNLLDRNVEVDQKEFRAHVTVARDWADQRLDEPVGPFTWSARDFVLVESKPGREGSEYRVLQRWPLEAADRE